jgi:hypothetical protein
MDPRAVLVMLAAQNNAEWCDLVCRTQGVATKFDQDAWVAVHRSPPLYPDAVTLRKHLPAHDLLPRIDASSGCSIKDSFASLDLSADGFRLLFEAEWIHRQPTRARVDNQLDWSLVRTTDQLHVWAAAHGGGKTFSPALLNNPAVVILAARDEGDLVAGVIGSRSPSVIGLSNLFIREVDPEQVWAEASEAIGAQFAGLPLVGYEEGASLRAAHRTGFVSVGPLRVWLNN